MKLVQTFGHSFTELSDACWEVIKASGNYFGEQRGAISSIKEIDYKDPLYRNTWGVARFERTFAISYMMFNTDGSSCSSTVYWSSLKGGILCYGTDSWISFRMEVDMNPVMLTTFSIGFEKKKISINVAWGGTEPTLESKNGLINLIMQRKGIKYWTLQHYPTQVMYVLYGQRDSFHSPKKFLKTLLKTNFFNKGEKKAVKCIEYLGVGIPKRLSSEVYKVFKMTYTDGTNTYKKINASLVKSLFD